ncbi:hypothetical protein NPIL_284701 [Nephila pilipes]|uniref:Uncharacterized protein n=1 Tax=Nephila pilipes TaxID=299642 RepID=A0A8X6PEA1_NEPPI|nr:hypothetical protein NPIL_284701 [Nephila pilipes]
MRSMKCWPYEMVSLKKCEAADHSMALRSADNAEPAKAQTLEYRNSSVTRYAERYYNSGPTLRQSQHAGYCRSFE